MIAPVPRELRLAYSGTNFIARVPFLVNDSVSDKEAKRQLADQTVAANDMFAGIAGLRALDLIATVGRNKGARYQQAVLIDQNTTQVKAMNAVLQLVKEAPNAEYFIKEFARHHVKWVNEVPRLSRDYKYLHKPGKTDRRETEDWNYFGVHGNTVYPKSEADVTGILMHERKDPNSWLHEDNFGYIKQMIEEGRLHTAIIDLADPHRVKTLKEWITKDCKCRVSDFYISSLECFADANDVYDYYGRVNKPEHRIAFFNNLKELLTNDSGQNARLIHSQLSYQVKPYRFQLLVEGMELIDKYLGFRMSGDPFYQKPFGVGDRAMLLTSNTRSYEDLPDRIILTVCPENPLVGAKNPRLFTMPEQMVLRSAFRDAGLPVDERNSAVPDKEAQQVVIGFELPVSDLDAKIDQFVTLASERLKAISKPGRMKLSPHADGHSVA